MSERRSGSSSDRRVVAVSGLADRPRTRGHFGAVVRVRLRMEITSPPAVATAAVAAVVAATIRVVEGMVGDHPQLGLPEPLPPEDDELLAYLQGPLTFQAIADELGLTRQALLARVRRVYWDLEVSNRAGASRAARHGRTSRAAVRSPSPSAGRVAGPRRPR